MRDLPDDPLDHSIVDPEKVRGSRDGLEHVLTVDLTDGQGHLG